MNHQALHELPKSVRENFNRLTDADVASDPRVRSAQAALAEATTAERAGTARYLAARKKIDKLAERGVSLLAQVAAIEADRSALAGRVVSGEAADADDRVEQARCADLRRQVELLKLAREGLESDLAATASRRDGLASAASDAQQQLESAQDAAKLVLAHQRAVR
jgi:chromosome segregation ATPase